MAVQVVHHGEKHVGELVGIDLRVGERRVEGQRGGGERRDVQPLAGVVEGGDPAPGELVAVRALGPGRHDRREAVGMVGQVRGAVRGGGAAFGRCPAARLVAGTVRRRDVGNPASAGMVEDVIRRRRVQRAVPDRNGR